MTMNNKNEKSLGMLFADLARASIDLIGKEVALGRAEIAQKLASARVALKSVAIGAVLLLAGLFLLLQALVGVLAVLLPPQWAPWLAPLLAGAVVAIAGYVMIKGGRTNLHADQLMPKLSIDSLAQDKNMIKQKMH